MPKRLTGLKLLVAHRKTHDRVQCVYIGLVSSFWFDRVDGVVFFVYSLKLFLSFVLRAYYSLVLMRVFILFCSNESDG